MTEQDLVDRIIDYLSDGFENMEQAKCLFFTWAEFFNEEQDDARTKDVLQKICDALPYEDYDEIVDEFLSVLV